MAVFNAVKQVAELPPTLQPNTIYLLRVGAGFDLYCSDVTGSIAYQPNNYELLTIPLGFVGTDAELSADLALLGELFPFDFTIQDIKLTLTTAPTGSNFIVDIKKNTVSIFSNLLSVDAGEKTSVTAMTPYALSTTSITKGDLITFSVTQVGAVNAGQYPVIIIEGFKL